ncbi:M24 family metallopeptidase [candidate division KSB1 bacterium]|nr:M24 family metallopeptidase [candidate division KSB1 bacterium]NIR71291.1 M24 family metallopeptidase [candidate division KSB1 bacterium]NIS24821.1 M24 family metallopeptidase [candidate division KSB1 bacterium]NIT71727.1 M24 family metallopeptidase [candidate division KSB1 bacterium]NIU25456.1 M24 family metallopeptidase [candidate division KSB1 bacterium]
MKFVKIVVAMLLVLFAQPAVPLNAQSDMPIILSMRERAEMRDTWLTIRLNTVVPELLRRENIDMWIIIAREYNEDPVIKTMLPAKWLAARRRTILVFHDSGPEKGVERLAVARYDIGEFFNNAWDKEKQPDQWQRLAEVIEERDPQRIALNYSETFALADGITHSEFEAFRSAVPQKYLHRIVSGERLAIGWLETRTQEEIVVYATICRIAHRIIAEGLSDKVVQPTVITTDDVEWWYRERIRELKLVTWFHPSVSVQRAEEPGRSGSFAARPESQTIMPGDLIHVDFGITYLGLNTDTQQHAYVLKPGENDAPEGLKRALAIGNRLQDILNSNFVVGRTGNEILAISLEQAKTEGIKPTIYTHPIGFHGHGAGPTIGLWDQQDGVPGKGDYELFYNTAHSNELNVNVAIPEWDNKEIRIMLEEDIIFTEEGVRFIDGRQAELHLIPR